MNKKSVFARRLAKRDGAKGAKRRGKKGDENLGNGKGALSSLSFAPRAFPSYSLFISRLAIPFRSSLMDSYIITGASRSRITLDKYHRERKDMKFSGQ